MTYITFGTERQKTKFVLKRCFKSLFVLKRWKQNKGKAPNLCVCVCVLKENQLLLYYFRFEVMSDSFGELFCILGVTTGHLQNKEEQHNQTFISQQVQAERTEMMWIFDAVKPELLLCDLG